MPVSQFDEFLDRSDEARRELAEACLTGVGQEVWGRGQSVEVSEAGPLSLRTENRDPVSGGRGHDESALSVDLLVRIREARAPLERR